MFKNLGTSTLENYQNNIHLPTATTDATCIRVTSVDAMRGIHPFTYTGIISPGSLKRICSPATSCILRPLRFAFCFRWPYPTLLLSCGTKFLKFMKKIQCLYFKLTVQLN